LTVTYLLVSTLIARFLLKCGLKADDPSFYLGWQYRAMQAGPTALLVLLPLSLIRDMSGFRHISVISIFALIYTGIVLIVELPGYAKYAGEHPD